jgi:hypothetical protein
MKYYIVHNTIEVFSCGEILDEQVITTGYPNVEYFVDKLFYIQRLLDFGITYEEPTPSVPIEDLSEGDTL